MVASIGRTNRDDSDYPATESYLSLLVGVSTAVKLTKALRKEEDLQHFAAKDILRAAGLPLLPRDDSEVASDLEKVKFGKKAVSSAPARGHSIVGR
jgi:hypothetical protein